MAVVLRPDAKGRVGIDSLSRQIKERFGGRPISGYSAEITPDGAILLRPRVELPAEEAGLLLLADRDRDAFVDALSDPPPPSARLSAAARRHRKLIKPVRGA